MNIGGSSNELEVDLSKTNELAMEGSKKRSILECSNKMDLDLGKKGDFAMKVSKKRIFVDEGNGHNWNFFICSQ